MEKKMPGNRFFNMARETMEWEKRRADLSRRFVETFQHAFRHAEACKDIYDPSGWESALLLSAHPYQACCARWRENITI